MRKFLKYHLSIKKVSSSNAKFLEFNKKLNKVTNIFNSDYYKNLSPVFKLTHKMNYNFKINTNLYNILKINNVNVSNYFEKKIPNTQKIQKKKLINTTILKGKNKLSIIKVLKKK